jgi:hypothetical protein
MKISKHACLPYLMKKKFQNHPAPVLFHRQRPKKMKIKCKNLKQEFPDFTICFPPQCIPGK